MSDQSELRLHDELISNIQLNTPPLQMLEAQKLIEMIEEHRGAGILRRPEMARKIAFELLRRGLDATGRPAKLK